MRATRAYLAGLGTTGVLLLAAVAILVTASALLGFNGWPGPTAADDPARVVIDPGAAEDASGPEQIAVAAVVAGAADEVALASAPVTPADPGATAGGGGAPRGEARAVEPRTDPAPAPPDRGPEAPADPAPPAAGDSPAPAPSAGGSAGPQAPASLTDGLADGVEALTTFLGEDALAPISPQLGRLVTDTGRALTDLVRSLDGTPPGS